MIDPKQFWKLMWEARKNCDGNIRWLKGAIVNKLAKQDDEFIRQFGTFYLACVKISVRRKALQDVGQILNYHLFGEMIMTGEQFLDFCDCLPMRGEKYWPTIIRDPNELANPGLQYMIEYEDLSFETAFAEAFFLKKLGRKYDINAENSMRDRENIFEFYNLKYQTYPIEDVLSKEYIGDFVVPELDHLRTFQEIVVDFPYIIERFFYSKR